MALKKEEKEYLIEILRDAYKNPKYDQSKIVHIARKLQMQRGQKISKIYYGVDSIFEEIKKYFPLNIIDESWKEEIENLIDIDGYDDNTIIDVVKWCRKDTFWKKQILSFKKLRKKDKEGIMYFVKMKYLMENDKTGQKLYTYSEMCDKVKIEGSDIWNQYEKIKKNNITYWKKNKF